MVAEKEGNTLSLFAQNDSAYNVSISNVKLKVGGKEYTVDSKSVLPFSGVSMPVKVFRIILTVPLSITPLMIMAAPTNEKPK